jgi:hypothetical protein
MCKHLVTKERKPLALANSRKQKENEAVGFFFSSEQKEQKEQKGEACSEAARKETEQRKAL